MRFVKMCRSLGEYYNKKQNGGLNIKSVVRLLTNVAVKPLPSELKWIPKERLYTHGHTICLLYGREKTWLLALFISSNDWCMLYMKTLSILLSRFRKHLRKSLLPKFLLFQRKHDESQDLQINTLNIYQIAYDRWGIDSWMDIVSIILDEAINWWLYFFLRALSEDM